MKKIIIPLLFVSNLSQGQKLFSKNNIAVYSLAATSGFLAGLNESLYAYNPFEGSQFSDPYISWKNQYKNHLQINGKSFQGKYLAFTTDLNHASAFGRDMSMCVAVGISWEDFKDVKSKKWYIVKKTLICWGVRSLTHTTALNIFKQ